MHVEVKILKDKHYFEKEIKMYNAEEKTLTNFE